MLFWSTPPFFFIFIGRFSSHAPVLYIFCSPFISTWLVADTPHRVREKSIYRWVRSKYLPLINPSPPGWGPISKRGFIDFSKLPYWRRFLLWRFKYPPTWLTAKTRKRGGLFRTNSTVYIYNDFLVFSIPPESYLTKIKFLFVCFLVGVPL